MGLRQLRALQLWIHAPRSEVKAMHAGYLTHSILTMSCADCADPVHGRQIWVQRGSTHRLQVPVAERVDGKEDQGQPHDNVPHHVREGALLDPLQQCNDQELVQDRPGDVPHMADECAERVLIDDPPQQQNDQHRAHD